MGSFTKKYNKEKGILMSIEAARLLALAEAILNEEIPTWRKHKPTYLREFLIH